MSAAIDIFNSGDLDGAIQAAVEDVRDHPANVVSRLDLSTLLAFAGDLERADKHALVAIKQANGAGDREMKLQSLGLRSLLRGEAARRQTFEKGVIPEVIGEFTAGLQMAFRAVVAASEGDLDAAVHHIKGMSGAAQDISGERDDISFSSFRVKDGFTSLFFEVISPMGEYYWVPVDQVTQIHFDPLARIQDLLWRHVHVFDTTGQPTWCYFPVLYQGSYLHEDDAIKCARASEWHDSVGTNRGFGVRFFRFDEDDVPVTELESIRFYNEPAEGQTVEEAAK